MDIKNTVCMDNNGKDAKNTRHISRRVHFVRNGENCTTFTGAREVCSWQILELRMLLGMIYIQE